MVWPEPRVRSVTAAPPTPADETTTTTSVPSTTTTTAVDGTTTTSSSPTTSTSTTVAAGTTTTRGDVDADDADKVTPVGPDVTGPAKKGLCNAYVRSADKGHVKNPDAIAFRNLLDAAGKAGQTVQVFCADVLGTSTTTGSTTQTTAASTSAASHGRGADNGKGKGKGGQNNG